MKRALLLDLETTGIDPKVDRVVEIGMVLYSLEFHTILRCMSAVVDAGIGNAAVAVNGIPATALVGGLSEADAFGYVQEWMACADVVLAHNAAFDLSFLPEALRTTLPVVCTMSDVQWPRSCSSKGLTAIALAHGLGISHAHRALTDCLTIARLLERAHELGADIQAMLARAMVPKSRFVALVSYDNRGEAKSAGFQWDPLRKVWHRMMVPSDAAKLPFAVREVAA